jgi:Carboxypeptidase regulatory-like domain
MRTNIVVLGILVAVGASSMAYAQRGDSGAIVGSVIDQSGTPIKGVKVTIRSSTQIGGVKTTYSDAEGLFRFLALAPGEFELTAEAPKLTRYIQKSIKVGINAPVEVNAVMEVRTDVEEVRVVERPPLVSTTTANIKETYDIDFVDSLPQPSRDGIYQSFVNNTAGTIGNGRVRGGNEAQTLYTMDGFNLLGQSPTLRSAAAYEIQTGAYGPDNATASGGVANIVSRVGSNKFEASIAANAETQQTRFFLDAVDSKTPSHMLVLNPSISGPIIKDRLWYSVNVELLSQKIGRDADVQGFYSPPQAMLKNWYKGTVNLTWQVSSRNKLQTIMNFDEVWEFNRRGLGFEREAQEDRRGQRYFLGAIWQSLLTDNIIFRSQVSGTTVPQHIFPQQCNTNPDCDNNPAVVNTFPQQQTLNNDPNHQRNDQYVFQFINRLEWYVSGRRFGEHNLQFKDNFYLEQDIFRTSVPGDMITQFRGPAPDRRDLFFSNDPRYDDARTGWFITSATSQRNVLSLSDSWRPTRFVTVQPGVAYASAWVDDPRGNRLISNGAFAPSLSLIWDATHDGRTALRGSYNNYVDVDIGGLGTFAAGTQVLKRCSINDAGTAYDKNCVFQGGSTNTVGLPCGPTGTNVDGTPCKETLRIPRTEEFSLGGEREVVQGVAVGLDLVYRRFKNQYEQRETNRIWTNSDSALNPTGDYRNGRAQTILDLGTPDDARRRYVGVTGSVTKREGRLKMRASYTWSRLDGTLLNGLDGSALYGLVAPRNIYLDGPLADDHRHEVHLTMQYQITPWLTTGVRYLYYSGLPYNRFFRNDVSGNFDNLRAMTGINPGTNINDPNDDRALRLPDIQDLNAQIRINWAPLIHQRLETFVDVLNILALRTTTSYGVNDGTDFGVARNRMAPLRMRFGLQYRY